MSGYTVKITNIEERINETKIVDFDVNDGCINVGSGSVECGNNGNYYHENRQAYRFDMDGDVTETTILAAVNKALNV
jgi:hypothetical protein